MNSFLNKKRINYILFHLKQHYYWEQKLDDSLYFGNLNNSDMPYIYFPLSKSRLKKVKYINKTPILFPLTDKSDWYFFDEKKNLIFNDDLLKSAFYLLSGYQETLSFFGDTNGRFMYSDSIQKKLEIVYRPIVNTYFEVMGEGIETFCNYHNIEFKRKNFLESKNSILLLTHDVDRVDKYTFAEFKLRLKQVFQAELKDMALWKRILEVIYTFFKIFSRNNPYWNFSWMKNLEKQFGFRSIWFFLPKGQLHRDAYYSFDEPRIQHLFRFLQNENDEIALHSTFHSAANLQIMKNNLDNLKSALSYKPIGNRQHWLNIKYPQTLQNVETLGLAYDSSWGFADMIGWRNSYCHPFRPYDLAEERMMDIWEFPLTVMDVAIFKYQKLTYKQALEQVDAILNQIQKYKGVFVLLWHNSFLDEHLYPGIKHFYSSLLNEIHQRNFNSVTGIELLEIINKNKR